MQNKKKKNKEPFFKLNLWKRHKFAGQTSHLNKLFLFESVETFPVHSCFGLNTASPGCSHWLWFHGEKPQHNRRCTTRSCSLEIRKTKNPEVFPQVSNTKTSHKARDGRRRTWAPVLDMKSAPTVSATHSQHKTIKTWHSKLWLQHTAAFHAKHFDNNKVIQWHCRKSRKQTKIILIQNKQPTCTSGCTVTQMIPSQLWRCNRTWQINCTKTQQHTTCKFAAIWRATNTNNVIDCSW